MRAHRNIVVWFLFWAGDMGADTLTDRCQRACARAVLLSVAETKAQVSAFSFLLLLPSLLFFSSLLFSSLLLSCRSFLRSFPSAIQPNPSSSLLFISPCSRHSTRRCPHWCTATAKLSMSSSSLFRNWLLLSPRARTGTSLSFSRAQRYVAIVSCRVSLFHAK